MGNSEFELWKIFLSKFPKYLINRDLILFLNDFFQTNEAQEIVKKLKKEKKEAYERECHGYSH